MNTRYIFIAVGILVCLAGTGTAQNVSIDPVTAPQQNTTGPVPPPGVSPPEPWTLDASRAENVLIGVPAYIWHHGCGPTAVGMVVGYYDGMGYPDLIPGNTSTQTTAVNQAIASWDNSSNPQHYEDYSEPIESGQPAPLPDKSEPPPGDEHVSNCIADFMETSWSARGNFYGWSWSSDIGPAFTDYVNLVAPMYTPSWSPFWYGTGTWDLLRNEIDAGRPLVFLVDSSGDGNTDHFVTVIGYRDSNGYPEYACRDTWYPTVRWARLREMSSSYGWGVWGGTTFTLSGGTPVPALSGFGIGILLVLAGIGLIRRKKI
ncbi:MAG TPA: hypothetical protein PLV45_18260 [bacterium]|nr:hypothetical protein [bacterium]